MIVHKRVFQKNNAVIRTHDDMHLRKTLMMNCNINKQ